MGGKNLVYHVVQCFGMGNAKILSASKALLSDGEEVMRNSIVTSSRVTVKDRNISFE